MALSNRPQLKEYYKKVMKIARFIAAVAMLTATVICVSAQTKPARPPQPAGGGATNRGCPGQQNGNDLFGRFSRSENRYCQIQ